MANKVDGAKEEHRRVRKERLTKQKPEKNASKAVK